jgi:serpin B
LPEVEKKLSAKALAQALAQCREASLQVALPRFKITEEFSLAKELEKLGMQDAFRLGVADLTGMETDVRQENSLFISAVAHKAIIDVDEKGTEAAAATGVIGGAGSG